MKHSEIFQQLVRHHEAVSRTSLVELFQQDPGRFDAMQAGAAGLLLDYSRNLISRETIDLFDRLAREMDLQGRIDALFNGEPVNVTEARPALHTALRDFAGRSPHSADIADMLEKMQSLAGRIRSGDWKGCTGRPVTDVVNIGIGGSHLGPMLVTDALAARPEGPVRCHFVSNLDSADLHSVLSGLMPERTLFIVASKSFTTQETLQNAKTARRWLGGIAADTANLDRHFLAVTAQPDRAVEFGIAAENILPMWDWVGGRYSLWSAIGLPIAIATDMENFTRLRCGAAEMDEHFRTADFRENLPALLAFLDIWYLNFHAVRSRAVLPYCHRLRYFPEFLQQLEMESNGKSVHIDGRPVDYQTAGVTWGTVETNGQHSFHQLLHQGTELIPVDFICTLKPEYENDPHHPQLYANCLAQARVLMTGRDSEDIHRQLVASGLPDEAAQQLARHQQMPGNRPSTMIVMEQLTAETLGALIALYEHKVYVQSVIWDINAFDQYGVEWGKIIGTRIFNRLQGKGTDLNLSPEESFDPATEGLINLYRKRGQI